MRIEGYDVVLESPATFAAIQSLAARGIGARKIARQFGLDFQAFKRFLSRCPEARQAYELGLIQGADRVKDELYDAALNPKTSTRKLDAIERMDKLFERRWRQRALDDLLESRQREVFASPNLIESTQPEITIPSTKQAASKASPAAQKKKRGRPPKRQSSTVYMRSYRERKKQGVLLMAQGVPVTLPLMDGLLSLRLITLDDYRKHDRLAIGVAITKALEILCEQSRTATPYSTTCSMFLCL
jgi:hypothetical protein